MNSTKERMRFAWIKFQSYISRASNLHIIVSNGSSVRTINLHGWRFVVSVISSILLLSGLFYFIDICIEYQRIVAIHREDAKYIAANESSYRAKFQQLHKETQAISRYIQVLNLTMHGFQESKLDHKDDKIKNTDKESMDLTKRDSQYIDQKIISIQKQLQLCTGFMRQRFLQLRQIMHLAKQPDANALPKPNAENLKSAAMFTDTLINLEKRVAFIPCTSPLRSYIVTSGFGYRNHPIASHIAMHHGIDLQSGHNAPIYATANGVVSFAGSQRGYGYVVYINHKNGFTTRYAHLRKTEIKVGTNVKRGDIIGHQGLTGETTGEHLHYEIRQHGGAINPYKFITAMKS